MNNIGLLIIATKKYNKFLGNLIASADKFFLKNHLVTYFVFTDDIKQDISSKRNIQKIEIKHKEWPFMTLKRYEIFYSNKDALNHMDYLYYLDVDSLFVDDVSDEILSDFVVTEHHGFWKLRGTPEDNEKSTACIKHNEKIHYVCGGFNGGKKDNFLKMSEILSNNINLDLKNNIIAKWHDESHLNRYAVDNKPTLRLSPDYCYHENCQQPNYFTGTYIFNSNQPKILALSKDSSFKS